MSGHITLRMIFEKHKRARAYTAINDTTFNTDRDTLEQELSRLAQSCCKGKEQRNVDVFLSVTGWDGHGKRTLQDIADIENVTKERVRQITETLGARITQRLLNPDTAPLLHETIAILEDCTPRKLSSITRLLLDKRLIREGFDLEGFIHDRTEQYAGAHFDIRVMDNEKYLVSKKNHIDPVALLSKVKREIEYRGASRITDIAAIASIELAIPVPEHKIARLLLDRTDFRWLGPDREWFWLVPDDTKRNRLLTQINKMLSVAEYLPLADLIEGISRNFLKPTARGCIDRPPAWVILNIFRQCEESGLPYRSRRDLVMMTTRLDKKTVLSEAESIMADILEVNGHEMNVMEFEERALAMGVSKSLFRQYLTFSPIFVQESRSLWRMRIPRIHDQAEQHDDSP